MKTDTQSASSGIPREVRWNRRFKPRVQRTIVTTNTEGDTVVDIEALFEDKSFLKKAEAFKKLFSDVQQTPDEERAPT